MDALSPHMEIATAEVGISPSYGFLGDELPLTSLSSYFSKWEALLAELPEKIRTKTLRDAVHQLPELDFSEETLKSELEWRRAYVMLCFLGQGYIWMEGEDIFVSKLPKKIAVPWVTVSKHLGLKPVGTYSSTVLYNYGVRDASLPRDSLSNLYALHTFTGSSNEAHFFLVHVLMEMASAPAIQAAGTIHDLMAMKDDEKIIVCLNAIKHSMPKVREVVQKMYDGCNKKKFYDEIRPYFSAKNKETVYEGVSDCPDLHGASAAQSTGMYALSILLGVEQSEKTRMFMLAMMDYMPASHRDFLINLKAKTSFREYCRASGNIALIELFDEAVDELVKFRNQHIILVTSYIVNQTKMDDVKGTGGAANAVNFLKDIRDKTIEAKIQIKK